MLNNGCIYQDFVKAEDAERTALAYYAARYRHSREEEWKKIFENGEISRNGEQIGPEAILAAGDRLSRVRPPWEEPEVPTAFRVVYEDELLLAIDKPSGLPVHPDGGFLENTLTRLLQKQRPELQASPVHRLGRGTSGLILFAKTTQARAALCAQFRSETAHLEGNLVKKYHAVTAPYRGLKLAGGGVGVVKTEGPRGTLRIETPIGRVAHPLMGTVYAASAEGLPALSLATPIFTNERSATWEVQIMTGRAHQIRIHMASIGYPLLGDPLFRAGGGINPAALASDIGYELRSLYLRFVHPGTRQPCELKV